MQQQDILSILTPDRIGLIILAFLVFFLGVFIIARSASKRERISLVKLLIWHDITKTPYTGRERLARGLLLLVSLGILIFAFQ